MTSSGTLPLVLLCGGENDRLEELRGTIYKPFLEIHGTTLVAKHVERARRNAVSRVLVVIDRPDPLVAALVDEYQSLAPGIPIELHQVPGTTADKVKWATERLMPTAGALYVSFADTFCLFRHEELLAARDRGGVDSAAVIARFQMPFGTVVTRGETIIEFREKPMMEFDISLGHMLLGEVALRMIGTGMTIAESMEALASRNQLVAVRAEIDRFITVDSLQDVARAMGFFAGDASTSPGSGE